MNETEKGEAFLKGIIVKLTLVLKLIMRQSGNFLKPQLLGAQENQKLLTQRTRAEAKYLRSK